MARKVRHSRLESRTARLKLAVKPKPHTGPALADGVTLLYRRRAQKNGTWVLKAGVGDGRGRSYWTKRIGEADDYDEADGEKVLTFYQAQDKAKELTRRGASEAASNGAPVTVDGALKAYAKNLKARDANEYNARMPRAHLTAVLLAKPVSLLASRELEDWRNGLLDKIKPATINRMVNALCAALSLAAQHDKRIQNRDAWQAGLKELPEGEGARNVFLPDATVHAFVRAAYERDAKLGLLVDTLAITGARPSQAIRLRIEDLHDHPTQPKVMMPKSAKGGGLNRSENKHKRYSVPITPALATKLKAAVVGRAPEEPLLMRADGQPWSSDPSRDYSRTIRDIVESLGEDPDRVTIYALRHSSIIRRLLNNVPIRLVASLHNTSVGEIESNYSRFITEHADEHARVGLLEDLAPQPAPVSNVVPIGGR
ncbi:site-specific integrase [Bradyrhizobium sp. UFLA05-153]